MELVEVWARNRRKQKQKQKKIQKEVENNQQKPQFHISIHWFRIGE